MRIKENGAASMLVLQCELEALRVKRIGAHCAATGAKLPNYDI
jgi:hypothetical protein